MFYQMSAQLMAYVCFLLLSILSCKFKDSRQHFHMPPSWRNFSFRQSSEIFLVIFIRSKRCGMPLITQSCLQSPFSGYELPGRAGSPTSCHSKLTLKMLAKFTHALSSKSTNEEAGWRCQTMLSKSSRIHLPPPSIGGWIRMALGGPPNGRGDWWQAATLTLIVHYYL